jgi:hypothetical protein
MLQLIMEEIEKKYLGSEMDSRQCLLYRPELFERAFCAIIGSAGQSILFIICQRVQVELQIDDAVSYKR